MIDVQIRANSGVLYRDIFSSHQGITLKNSRPKTFILASSE